MINRKKTIERLMQTIHAMRHKLMVGYTSKKELLITPSQGFVLSFVAENNSVNTKAIAQALHVTSSAATQLVDSLVEKGYLLRKNSSNDRRVISLLVSQKGKKFFKEFKEQSMEKMTKLFNVLTDEELAQYAYLNKKITDSIINKKL